MKKILLLMLMLMFSCEENEKKTNSTENSSENNLMALVMKDGKYGYINTGGEYVIDPKYPLAHSFSNGLACVNLNGVRNNVFSGAIGGSYTFIDTNGDVKFKEKAFKQPISFFNDYAIVRLDDGTAGFIDKKMNLVAGGFDGIMPFREGLAAAAKSSENTLGFIDATGTWKIKVDPVGSRIGDFHEGYAFYLKDNKFGYINKQGEVIIEPTYDQTYDFHEGLGSFLLNNTFGFLNKEGTIVIPNQYEDVADFSEGLCAVQKNGKWGYINNKGETIIPFDFDLVRDFHEGFAAVSKGNKVGFIDTAGNWLVEPTFYNALDFKNGYAIISKNGKLGFINRKGEIVIRPIYDRVDNFVDPDASNENLRLN